MFNFNPRLTTVLRGAIENSSKPKQNSEQPREVDGSAAAQNVQKGPEGGSVAARLQTELLARNTAELDRIANIGDTGQSNSSVTLQPKDEDYPDFLAGGLTTDSSIKSVIVKRPTLKNILEQKGEWKDLPKVNYRAVDFIYSKWYGIIPNNYMITLTRSNLPVNDEGMYSLAGPAVEVREKDVKDGSFSAKVVAQAVTYIGKKTGNSLSAILGFNGNMRWDFSEEAKKTDIVGQNSIGGSLKLSDFGLSDGAKQMTEILTTGITASNVVQGVKSAFKGMGQGLAKAAGSGYLTYKILRSFAKKYETGKGESKSGEIAPRDALTIEQQQFDPYATNGIFARKSFGGVNKITTTVKRKQGIDFQQEIKLKFQYSLKNLAFSHSGKGPINSKVAMLDVIGNLMGLVLSNAEFYGGTNRYKPSNYQFDFSTDIKELMLTATTTDILRELKKRIELVYKSIKDDIGGVVDNFVKILSSSTVEELNAADKKSDDYENIFRLLFYEFFKTQSGKPEDGAFNLINMKPNETPALLTGMNVGEWHIIVGNPFNPIARIGNLVCTNYALNFPNDKLGPDDFPTEIEFTITLKPGRPRDRRGVTNMFGFIHKDRKGSTSTVLERTSATRDSDIDDAPSKINLQEALRRSYFRPGELVGPRRNIVGANALRQNLLEGGGLGAQDFLNPGITMNTNIPPPPPDTNSTGTTSSAKTVAETNANNRESSKSGSEKRFDNSAGLNRIVQTEELGGEKTNPSISPLDTYNRSAQLDLDYKKKEIEEGYQSEEGQEVGRFPNALLRLKKELNAGSPTDFGKLPPNLFNNF